MPQRSRLLHDTCLPSHILKGSISTIPIELILSPIADEQIDFPVIVIVANANALSPAAVGEICLLCDVGKSAVTAIPIEVIGRLVTFGETFQDGSIDLENVQKAIVVVVKKRNSTTGRLEQILVGLLATKHRHGIQPCLAGDIGKSALERFSFSSKTN